MEQDWTELPWQTQTRSDAKDAFGNSTEGTVYTHCCEHNDDKNIRQVINQAIDKAVSLFPANVWDQSRYVIFEWDKEKKILTIVISDDDKSIDSPDTVVCEVKAYQTNSDPELALEQADTIQYWVRDHLTTCTEFFAYSLIAVFHSHSRDNTSLL